LACVSAITAGFVRVATKTGLGPTDVELAKWKVAREEKALIEREMVAFAEQHA